MRNNQQKYDPDREAREAARSAHDGSLAELFKEWEAQLSTPAKNRRPRAQYVGPQPVVDRRSAIRHILRHPYVVFRGFGMPRWN